MRQVFTTSEAARRVGVSEGSIRKWEREGRLPAVKSERGTRFFTLEDLDRFAAQRGQAGRKRA